MSDLRVGIIGLGMMGRHHARVVRETSGVELVAVADPFGDVHRVAGPLTALENVDQLIAAGIDMAVCAVPTAQHEQVGLALAEAGVHTLIEKPIAHSVEAGERLVEAFTSRGLVGAVGHVERYNPALQSLRARMADGELGEIYQIATRRQGPFPARIADVGVVKDLATHDIDLTMWLARSSYTDLDAQLATRSGREHEDMVAATGRLANGVITNHLVNWLSPMKERVTVVTGERGAFVADTLTADLTFHGNGVIDTEWDSVANFRGVSEGDVTRFAIPKPEPLRTEHENFRDAVLGVGSGIVTLAEGLETLRTAEWLITSGRSARAEELPV
ncbi:Gfo/Idh/MocA family oxidoreductase [Pseudonocardia alni]|uniref:Gfo/Idh/MocA family protein n=1 Tax=Pseudonocardia alni TaxID=33907 RepID=UPI003320B01E